MNRLFTSLLLLVLPIYSFANSVENVPLVYKTSVIADHGGESISEYIPLMDKDNAERRRKVFNDRRSRKLVNAHFPIRSKRLSLGRLSLDQASEINYQMISQPLFLIGYDSVSINWLKANRGHLAKNKAIGLVVNVENSDQMDELQSIAGKSIRLQPTPGDDLASHLKISNYPFYMDNKGVMR